MVLRLAVLAAIVSTVACSAASAAANAAYVEHPDVSYDLDSPPSSPGLNALDLYVPDGLSASAKAPVVVFVHGGGWMRGDKGNRPTDKARLFTDAGYLYATINYRLSPVGGDGSDPNRVKFPDHPHDVGEALGWIDRYISAYGGDPDRIVLIGHSAGAQLVSLIGTDPSYAGAYGVEPGQIRGVVSLDAIFDIAQYADPSLPGNPPRATRSYWNAFGTPAENAATSSWYYGSPINFAEASDPEFLLVTQQRNAVRQQGDFAMAQALGQGAETVLLEPLDHKGINDALGNPSDASGETQAVLGFVQRVLAEQPPPVVKLRHKPHQTLRLKDRSVRISFRFKSPSAGARFECRLDEAEFKGCHSPRVYKRVERGRHKFRVRAHLPGGAHGPAKVFKFRVRPARS